jgi:hypothetical protein
MLTPYWQRAQRSFIEPARGGGGTNNKATEVFRLQPLQHSSSRDVQVPRAKQIAIIAAPADNHVNQLHFGNRTVFLYKHATQRQFCVDMHEPKLWASQLEILVKYN